MGGSVSRLAGRRRAQPGVNVAVAIGLACALSACAGGGYRYGGRPANYTPPGPPGDPWGPYIREAAAKFHVQEQWIRAVMRQESGGHQYLGGQLTTSSAGAMGLMQLMPETYRELEGRYGLGSDPYDPHDNIMAGTAYIREMYDRFGNPGFLIAYNAGPNRAAEYLAGSGGLPSETVNYVASIGPNLGGGESVAPPVSYAEAVPAAADVAPVSYRYTDEAARAEALAEPDPAPAPEVTGFGRVVQQAQAAEPPAASLLGTAAPVSGPAIQATYTPPRLAYAAPAAAESQGSGASGWGVQVGAFARPDTAQAVAARASQIAYDLFGSPRVVVQPVTTSIGQVLYRARVVGASAEGAASACARLSGSELECVVLPPGRTG